MSDSESEPEHDTDHGVEAEIDPESEPAETDDSGLDIPDPKLGQATIVYTNPDGKKTSRSVDNEHIVYFQDHWQLKTGTDHEGNDVIRRIPRQHVHYVERSVEEFQDRVDAMIDQARKRLPI